jgi:hypothetical protein
VPCCSLVAVLAQGACSQHLEGCAQLLWVVRMVIAACWWAQREAATLAGRHSVLSMCAAGLLQHTAASGC